MNLDHVLARLEGVQKSGKGWRARCPAHGSRSRSLAVSDGGDRILLKCFAGCEFAAVVEAIGLRPSDLFDGDHSPRPGPSKNDVIRAWRAEDAKRLMLMDIALLKAAAEADSLDADARAEVERAEDRLAWKRRWLSATPEAIVQTERWIVQIWRAAGCPERDRARAETAMKRIRYAGQR